MVLEYDSGRRTLAMRMVGQLRHDRQDLKALHVAFISPELASRFDDPPSDTETIDDVLAALYALADELDRAGGRER